jgi:Arc/MetJ-type ribon-helix-helix transcriptional regulator
MIVCFTCGPETKRQLDWLVASGHYHDHSEAISSAIQNLSVLHSELKDARSLVIDGSSTSPVRDSRNSSDPEPPGLEPGSRVPLSTTPDPRSFAPRTTLEPQIPALLQRRTEILKPQSFAPLNRDQLATSKSPSVERWMFGQFNRLLPAKVTCRALVNIVADGDDRQPLETIAIRIANEAAMLGRYLTTVDQKFGSGRDDAMAVAFPKSTSPSEFKSIQRFANQFVGSANRQGQLSGLPIALKLIGRSPTYSDGVTLTEAGWQFGRIETPILDAPSTRNPEKFTDEEISFLLEHILTSVPLEAFAYRTILNEVRRGVLTPDDLDVELSKLSTGQKTLQKSFISTQRSGAICRMVDLNLIQRTRTGTRVCYALSTRGAEFLRSTEVRFDEAKVPDSLQTLDRK